MSKIAKLRIDSWDAALTDAQRWTVFDKSRRASWSDVSEWIAKEYGVEAPSRSAFYRFLDRMRGMESGHRLEQAIIARNEAGELARSAKQDSTDLIEAYHALAADAALGTGDAKLAISLTKMALALSAANAKKVELELKGRSQDTKDAALKLAVDKFEAAERRLNEAKQVITNESLTDEQRTAKMKEIFGL